MNNSPGFLQSLRIVVLAVKGVSTEDASSPKNTHNVLEKTICNLKSVKRRR